MGEFWHRTDGGIRLWCRTEGPEVAPSTVVLTHGYAQASGCWHAQLDFLVAQGLRVLGSSQKAVGDGAGFRTALVT